jgi:hypothetical protein
VDRLRFAEYVPSPRSDDARVLGALPCEWSQQIAESAVAAVKRRADAVARTLAASGRAREAAALRRRVDVLARADELHEHAGRVEILAQLYRALAVIAHEPSDASLEAARLWTQAGATPGITTTAAPHGPAFRETAALRNRAFRWVLAGIERAARRSAPP